MSDDKDQPSTSSAGSGPHEHVGSVAEEAAKLFGALGDLARERGSDLGGTAAATAHHLSDAIKDANQHVGHGADCRYCPVCQAIRVVRETSPEVKAHLAVAASSLMQAAAGVLATQASDDRRTGPVEHIDLSDDAGDWDEPGDHESGERE